MLRHFFSFMIIVFLIGGGTTYYFVTEKEIYYLAVVGPMDGKAREAGKSMKQGAELALQEIKQQLPLDIDLELLFVNDQSEINDKYKPMEIAREIVRNRKVLAVIGHYYSIPTKAAVPIYAKHEIPVITPTATYPDVTQTSEWVFSLVYNDIYQSSFLANYVLYAMEKKKIAVIYSEIPYGITLKNNFIKELAQHGHKPVLTIGLPKKDMDPKIIQGQIEPLKDVDIIFVATHMSDAAKIIKYLKSRKVKTDIIGSSSLGTPKFIQEAGIFSENVYAISSFLPNLLGKGARKFAKNHKEQYGVNPDWISSHSFEAVHLITNAIRKKGIDKVAIKDYLRDIQKQHQAVENIGGAIYFDKYGGNQRSIYVGQVKNSRFVSAQNQLVVAKYPELYKTTKSENMLHYFHENYFTKATVVFSGIHIKEVEEINLSESRYELDLNLWFRWNGKTHDTIDFELVNAEVKEKKELEKYYDYQTKERFNSYSIKANFSGKFPLHEYPFDLQILRVQVKPKKLSTNELLFVSDINEEGEQVNELDLGVWVEQLHTQFVDIKTFLYSYRNPQFDKKMFHLNYSLLNYEILIARKVTDYLIKVIPLLIMVLVVSISFFINAGSEMDTRIELSLLGLLTAVAFHQTMIDVGYLIKMDYFFLTTYVLIFLVIVETVYTNYLFNTGRIKLSHHIDIISFISYILLTSAALAGIMSL